MIKTLQWCSPLRRGRWYTTALDEKLASVYIPRGRYGGFWTAILQRPASLEHQNSKDKLYEKETAAVETSAVYVPPADAAEKPPYPENCCGNGCANCVLLDYFEALDAWEKEQSISAQPLSRDPSMSAFLALEQKIKRKEKRL